MSKIQVHRDIVIDVNLREYNISDKEEQKKLLIELKKCADPALIYAVKVFDEDAGERFWCRVIKVEEDKIHATVDNDLVISILEYEDKLIFGPEHVIDVYSKKLDQGEVRVVSPLEIRPTNEHLSAFPTSIIE